VHVLPAAVTGVGVPATPARSSRVIELSGQEIQLLKRAVYLRYGMGLGTPGTGPVSFRSIDGIDIRIWSEMTYEVAP
jgi:hypothetical protein